MAARPEVTGRKTALSDDVARPEVRGRKTAPPDDDVADDVDAESISQFCKRNGFSVQMFYKDREKMPETFNVGARVLIARETSRKWRREKEAIARREREAAKQA